MNLNPPLYYRYLAKHYSKNILQILFGLSLLFAVIDYFQHVRKLEPLGGSYQLLYVFYIWEDALTILYPLSLVFAVIMTKMALVKNGNFTVLHAFGYSKKKLVAPLLFVSLATYTIFMILHTTEFSYAKDRAKQLLQNEYDNYQVKDLFFKYNDNFVYVKQLDPIHKVIEDITLFKVEGNRVHYTIKSPAAYFNGEGWDAKDAILKTHIYEKGTLQRYALEHKKSIQTLKGYKPKIIESLHEGKTLSIIDAYYTWKLFSQQSINSDKIRATVYEKAVMPLFSIAMVILLFFKLPFHARMHNMSAVLVASMGITITVWGVLYGLGRIGYNGVVLPELSTLLPIGMLLIYSLYVYGYNESKRLA